MIMVSPKGMTLQRISRLIDALYGSGHLGFGTPPVADGEIEDAEENPHRKEGRHGQQEVEQMIHHRRDAGRLHRK